MPKTDLLASPTLAQLYLAQGHHARAREQVTALLAKQPRNGVALSIQQRLVTLERPRLELEADRSLRLRWEIPSHLWAPDLHLVLAVTPRGRRSAPHYLSGPARKAIDEMTMPFPYAGGSATACIATLRGDRRDFRVLACAAPTTW